MVTFSESLIELSFSSATTESLDRREQSKIADALVEIVFQPNETIAQQGEYENDFYIIEEGEAVVYQQAPGAKYRREVGRLGPKSHFGEIVMIYDRPQVATVVAVTKVRCVKLDRAELERLGPYQDTLKRNIARLFC